eukprot:147224-Rhodomonas_salina.1
MSCSGLRPRVITLHQPTPAAMPPPASIRLDPRLLLKSLACRGRTPRPSKGNGRDLPWQETRTWGSPSPGTWRSQGRP